MRSITASYSLRSVVENLICFFITPSTGSVYLRTGMSQKTLLMSMGRFMYAIFVVVDMYMGVHWGALRFVAFIFMVIFTAGVVVAVDIFIAILETDDDDDDDGDDDDGDDNVSAKLSVCNLGGCRCWSQSKSVDAKFLNSSQSSSNWK